MSAKLLKTQATGILGYCSVMSAWRNYPLHKLDELTVMARNCESLLKKMEASK